MSIAAGESILAAAKTQLGIPYGFGAKEWNVRLDCSGLTAGACLHGPGIVIVAGSGPQYQQALGGYVSGPWQLGDILYFITDGTRSNPGHCGIYAGNNQMIDAPHTGSFVRYDNIWLDYVGATRPANVIPEPLPPPQLTEDDMSVITTNPNNQGKILLNTNDGTYKGFSNPGVYNYFLNTVKLQEVPPPDTATFSKLTQTGTI